MTTGTAMPKKPKKHAKDQHASNFLVRIPEAYRNKLGAHKRATGCPFAEAVRRALDAYLKANGIEPPTAAE